MFPHFTILRFYDFTISLFHHFTISPFHHPMAIGIATSFLSLQILDFASPPNYLCKK